jgi:hypothetical protein
MPEIVDGLKDPYGLNGGAVLSGSITKSCDAFWYYPVTNTTATVVISNLSGSNRLTNVSFTSGNGVYGNITEVTQSAGIAIVYSGSYFYPNLRK